MDRKEKAIKLVDEILVNDTTSKKLVEGEDLVDKILDEVENKIQHIPDQDLESLQQAIYDELTKDTNRTDLEKQMMESVKMLLSEESYKEFFQKMLKHYNVNSPSELDKEKKKEFFDKVDKGWKAKKETD